MRSWEHRPMVLDDPGRHATPMPAPLPSPSSSRVPVDVGLAGLGLVTLAGAGFGGTLTLALFVWARTFGEFGQGGVLPLLLLFAAGLVRSAFHIAVGRALIRRSAAFEDAVMRYLWVSAGHAVIVALTVLLVFASSVRVSTVLLAFIIGAALMTWPVTLVALVRRRSVRAIFGTAKIFDLGLVPGDRSIVSAGLLMTVFGLTFLAIDVALFVQLVASGTRVSKDTAVFHGILALFAARSCMHIGWGLAALRGKLDVAAFRRATSTYLWLAVLSAVATLVAVFFIPKVQAAFHNAPINVIYASVVIAAWLTCWPLALRTFVLETIPHWELEADGERPFRPAVDRGLTTLGYLLLCTGGAAAMVALLGMFGLSADRLFGSAELPQVHVVLLDLATCGAQIWAGLELVDMRARYRVAVAVYVVAAVVSGLVAVLASESIGEVRLVGWVARFVLPLTALALSRLRV